MLLRYFIKFFKEYPLHLVWFILAFILVGVVGIASLQQNNKLGANPLPQDNYDTVLSAPLSSSATTVYVNTLPTITESIYTIYASDGRTVKEKIYCTNTTTTPSNALTGCVRGLSSVPVAGVIDETAGTGVSHSKNARIAITDNINFSGKALSFLYGNQALPGNLLLDQGYITGLATATSSATSSAANVDYVNSIAIAGAPDASEVTKGIVEFATDSEVLSGTETGGTGALLVMTPGQWLDYNAYNLSAAVPFGETITAGQILTVSSTDGRYYKADADVLSDAQASLVMAYEGGSAGEYKKVLFPGSVIYSLSSLTTSSPYYLSNTAGGVSTSTGTNSRYVGSALSQSTFMFYPEPVQSTATATANAVVKADGSGKIDDGWIQHKFGGDGSDGALDVTSGTTTIDLGNAAYVVKDYTSINVSAGATLAFQNPNTNGTIIVLKSQGDATIDGTIDASGMGGAKGNGSTGTGANGSYGYGVVTTADRGKGGASYTTSVGGAASTAYLFTLNIAGKIIRVAPGAGGAGGGGSLTSPPDTPLAGGNGGAGGAGLIIEVAGALDFTGTIDVSGDNGSNGQNSSYGASGAGGGGAGGTLAIVYNTLTENSGTITVNGGNGGTGGTGSGGSGTTAKNYGGGGGSGGADRYAGGAGGDGYKGSAPTAGSNGGGTGGGTGGSAGSATYGGGGGGGGSAGDSYVVANTEFY